MSPAAVTMGAVTLSRSQSRRTESDATATVISITTIDERNPPITEITTKSAIEIVFSRPNATEMTLASTASTSEIDSDIEIDAARFWPTTVSRRRRELEGAGVDRGAEAATERTEHVAAHADGGGHEHEQARKRFEGAGDRAERQAGEKVTTRTDAGARRSPRGRRRHPSATARESARTTARHERSIGTRRFVHFSLHTERTSVTVPCRSRWQPSVAHGELVADPHGS